MRLAQAPSVKQQALLFVEGQHILNCVDSVPVQNHVVKAIERILRLKRDGGGELFRARRFTPAPFFLRDFVSLRAGQGGGNPFSKRHIDRFSFFLHAL